MHDPHEHKGLMEVFCEWEVHLSIHVLIATVVVVHSARTPCLWPNMRALKRPLTSLYTKHLESHHLNANLYVEHLSTSNVFKASAD